MSLMAAIVGHVQKVSFEHRCKNCDWGFQVLLQERRKPQEAKRKLFRTLAQAHDYIGQWQSSYSWAQKVLLVYSDFMPGHTKMF